MRSLDRRYHQVFLTNRISSHSQLHRFDFELIILSRHPNKLIDTCTEFRVHLHLNNWYTMEGKVTMTPEAYRKIMLHLMKYPTENVVGVLVGRVLEKGGERRVEAAIPVSHQWSSLGMVLQIAVEQVTLHYQTLQPDYHLLGLYYGDARLPNFSPDNPNPTELTLPLIFTQFDTLLRQNTTTKTNFTPFTIDVNPHLLTGDNLHHLEIYHYNPKQQSWSPALPSSTVDSLLDTPILPTQFTQSDLTTFFDFEDHLEHPHRPWL